MKHILIAGATGYSGGYIAEELMERNYFIRAITRSSSRLQKLHPGIDEIIKAEITKPGTLAGCCDGIDAVITTIGITRQKNKLTYMDVDYHGNLNLLNEAIQSGVRRFIYIFIYNGEKLSNLKIIQAKKKFADALKESSLNYCLINPTGFFSDMGDFFTMASKGTVYLFGNGENKINPVDGRDLAKICADAVETNEHEINIGGPEIFTYKQIAALAFDVLNKPVKYRRVPLWLKNVFLFFLRTFTPVYTYGPIEFLTTMLTTDMIAPEHGTHTLKNYFEELRDKQLTRFV